MWVFAPVFIVLGIIAAVFCCGVCCGPCGWPQSTYVNITRGSSFFFVKRNKSIFTKKKISTCKIPKFYL